MKYKCDMVKDLMPLCIDKVATKDSEKVVTHHLSECTECMSYYTLLNKEVILDEGQEVPDNKYVDLAKKIRKRNLTTRIVVAVIVASCIGLSINYGAGYRFLPQRAADLSGRLNYKSQLLGSTDWKDWKFYIYDSYSCYDIVLVQKTWHGWGITDTCLNWPKWFDENEGIEMAASLYHMSYDEGIQLFSFIVRDEAVDRVEVSVFGDTKIIDVTVGEFNLMTFESVGGVANELEATAYDANGNPIYTIAERNGYWVWEAIH